MDLLIDLLRKPEPERRRRVDLGCVSEQPITADVGEAIDRDLGGDLVVLVGTFEPAVVVGRLEPEIKKGLMAGKDPGPGPHRVIDLRDRPGCAEFGAVAGVTSPFDRREGDVPHPQMVGMLIVALILRVGDDHLRMLCTEDCNQAIHRLVVRSDREAVGVEVGVAVRHARISVAEHVNDVVADDRGGSVEFLTADLLKVVDDLRTVHRRVENVALLAPGAAHQHRANPLSLVLRDRAGSLRCLVVGMGVHGEDAERLGHAEDDTQPRGATGSSSISPSPSGSTSTQPKRRVRNSRPSSGPLAMTSSPANSRTRPPGR